MKLPDGFNTMLTSDGANLSQGQRRPLSIARAAIADTPLLILDEATSSIVTAEMQGVQVCCDVSGGVGQNHFTNEHIPLRVNCRF